ncbi:MAG TPA: tRNA (adenosine(37)-N6)-threonylcarbamoyltransferase complex dimerization subunit type 1 TsaB [Candidatus Lumbricidophila sp.]|nr:tRNA (adenosine(37)-N6)-threonylcarbamoyltransferase complex dimerization subunit type 1 TsaB [Candidatus Lumbricidophila sp.]
MILAIDTSAGTSVALRAGAGTLVQRDSEDPMRHAEAIGPLIADVLATAEIEPTAVDVVAVGVGPGPFTGLRVGIAAGEAFALGRGCALVPVPSHDAVAFGWYAAGNAGRLQVVTDARRREVAVSDYDGVDADGVPVRVGGPVLHLRTEVPEASDVRIEPTQIAAGDVARLAAALCDTGRSLSDGAAIYLRPPDVTLAAPKQVAQPTRADRDHTADRGRR